jgi:hypothetical protein
MTSASPSDKERENFGEEAEGPPSELPIVDDEDEETDDTLRTVLITGASGNIGRKLRAAWEDVYDLILIDQSADPGDDEVVVADLADADDDWMECFHGVDTVIHLAANPDEFSPWEELYRPNIDAVANVFQAAVLAGVERIIFASSNHVMGGYRELGDMPITEDLPPRPGNPYGATKLMGERLGRSLVAAYDLSFLALRIGWVQTGANRPDTLPDDWARSIWLSNDDMIGLFECAVEAELESGEFLVINGLSNNRGTRWDLTRAIECLGYEPQDDAYEERVP